MTVVERPVLAPEIIWFTPSEEYLEDPPKTMSVLHESSSSKGMLWSYYGTDAEDGETGVFVITWQSLEHHQAFMADESYVEFIMPVMDSMVGMGDITQALLRTDPEELRKALTAPLTAFIYVTMRQFHDREYELEPLVDKFRAELRSIPGCYGSAWGPSLQENRIEVGIVGWRSMADRNNAVRGRLRPIIQRVAEFAKVEIRYAVLSHLPTDGAR